MNEGLAVGLAVGLGLPLTIALIVIAIIYSHRRHPTLPKPNVSTAQTTQNWLNLYRETRPLSLTEKIRSIFETLGLVRKPVVQEVYVMENGAKVSK